MLRGGDGQIATRGEGARGAGRRGLVNEAWQGVRCGGGGVEGAMVQTSELNPAIISRLRQMARQGDSVGTLFRELKARLGSNSIALIIEYMRATFFLTVREVKPLAALTRTEQRDVMDEGLLNELVLPEIEKHRSEWDV